MIVPFSRDRVTNSLNEWGSAYFRQPPVSFKCFIHCFSLCCFWLWHKNNAFSHFLFYEKWYIPPSPTRWRQLKLSESSAFFRLFFFVTFLSCFISLMVESRMWSNNSYFFPLFLNSYISFSRTPFLWLLPTWHDWLNAKKKIIKF